MNTEKEQDFEAFISNKNAESLTMEGTLYVKAKGRTGQKKANPIVAISKDGYVRIDDPENPEFWIEFKLPK